MEKRITATTTLLGLLGSPVSHSTSPAMMNLAASLLGLDYAYLAFDVKEDQVPAALDAMRTLNIRGYNVTMPDKIAAAKNVDKLSPASDIIGASNTVVNDNGVLTGYITDGEGYVNMLKDNGIDIKGKKVVVAGGGGAATAIEVQSALDGAAAVTIFNIKDKFFDRTLATADKIKEKCPDCEVKVCDLADTDALAEEISKSDIFSNATIVGMKPMENESIIKDTSVFRPGLIVTDAVYNPVETKLLREAKAAGCTTIGGKGMLMWQGVASFKLFTGHDMPVEEIRKAFFS